MTTARSILVSALFLCWAILLATRVLAAAIHATAPIYSHSYSVGLEQIGWLLPASAWGCFAAALVGLLSSLIPAKKPRNSAE